MAEAVQHQWLSHIGDVLTGAWHTAHNTLQSLVHCISEQLNGFCIHDGIILYKQCWQRPSRTIASRTGAVSSYIQTLSFVHVNEGLTAATHFLSYGWTMLDNML